MISFETAIQIISEINYISEIEIVDIKNCLGRVLAENVVSDINMPPFDKSAVDGYACRKDDIKNELTVIETIQAGYVPQKTISKNQCSKIMTGAIVPKGAEMVLMVEDIEKITENTIIYKSEKSKENICFFAEDFKENDLLLEKNNIITASHIGVMATVGYVNIKVYKQPKISIISTGNEIIEPNLKPELSQIRNSNGYQLIALCQKIGINPNYLGIVEDTEESTRIFLKKAMEKSDLIIFTGGVSMGDYDFVPKILKEFGFEIKFNHLSVQPGKRTLFANYENKFCIGLPGNPVSTFVQFELLAKILIYKMQANNYITKIFRLPLAENYFRKRQDVKSFVPVKIGFDGKVVPIDYHGSAHLNALAYADGFMEINIGIQKIEEGEIVNVRQI